MLAFIIFVCAIVFALVIAFSMRGQIGAARSRYVRMLSPLVVCVGGALVVFNCTRLEQAQRRQQWPTVHAQVTETGLAGYRDLRPSVSYRYTVNGQAYVGVTDMNVPGFGLSSTQRDVAHSIVTEAKTDPNFMAYYNPEDPAQSVVKPGPTWDVFTQLSFGTMLLAFGACAIAHDIFTRSRQS